MENMGSGIDKSLDKIKLKKILGYRATLLDIDHFPKNCYI